MDGKKLAATIVGIGLIIAGALWKVDFKGMVCNGDAPAPQAQSQGAK